MFGAYKQANIAVYLNLFQGYIIFETKLYIGLARILTWLEVNIVTKQLLYIIQGQIATELQGTS